MNVPAASTRSFTPHTVKGREEPAVHDRWRKQSSTCVYPLHNSIPNITVPHPGQNAIIRCNRKKNVLPTIVEIANTLRSTIILWRLFTTYYLGCEGYRNQADDHACNVQLMLHNPANTPQKTK